MGNHFFSHSRLILLQCCVCSCFFLYVLVLFSLVLVFTPTLWGFSLMMWPLDSIFRRYCICCFDHVLLLLFLLFFFSLFFFATTDVDLRFFFIRFHGYLPFCVCILGFSDRLLIFPFLLPVEIFFLVVPMPKNDYKIDPMPWAVFVPLPITTKTTNRVVVLLSLLWNGLSWVVVRLAFHVNI